jgi:raffinose/stachyose/melibiose transport system permease protein
MSTKSNTASEIVGEIGRIVRTFHSLFSTLLVVFVGVVILYPLVILVSTSFRPGSEIFRNPLAFPDPSNLYFENFVTAWFVGGFGQYVLNSVVVVGASLVILVIICALASYALVQFDLPAEKALLLLIIGGFMLPAQALFVPNFLIMNELGLLNTRISLVIVYVAFSIPFTVFFFRQFFSTIPKDYAEAARLDGCSEFTIFSKIYMPLSIPAIMTVSVVQFVWLWNEFLYALVFITDDPKRTVPAGLMAFTGQLSTDWGPYTAGIIIAVIPSVIIFYAFQNYFIRGFTRGRVE